MQELIVSIFIAGYLFIAFEQAVAVNKAAPALLTGVLCWTAFILAGHADHGAVAERLMVHLGDVANILFFLLGAMTIVELIDAHGGFDVLTRSIRQTNRRSLLWLIALAAFFLSAVLDNLTTTIVVLSAVRKLVRDEDDRLLYAGAVVIAANAGGAWSPIGDVTTTMLWIGGQISAWRIMGRMLLPCLASVVVALLLIGMGMRGEVRHPLPDATSASSPVPRRSQIVVLAAGMLALMLVPVFKAVTHLPPCMGMLAGLALLWVLTERLHGGRSAVERQRYSVTGALQRIDGSVILFFLGILLAVAALQAVGVLDLAGTWLRVHIVNEQAINLLIGTCSAMIDNVPLVAAAQGMYGQQYPMDAPFWEFLAYCAGTGGSLLIIGSAAGVAAMGMEKLTFGWYLRRVGWIALLAYFAGAGVFALQASLMAR